MTIATCAMVVEDGKMIVKNMRKVRLTVGEFRKLMGERKQQQAYDLFDEVAQKEHDKKVPTHLQ